MSILAFQIPEKVVMDKSGDFHGVFTFKPLEKGYGVTIGNALRRILLSSLEGYAITGIKLPGVLHEFSTIEGVVEDLSEIILNLKMVRFKKISEDEDNKININISGRRAFKASDIGSATHAFEILNPKHVICHLDSNVTFEIELTLAQGRGYVPAEENKPEEQIFGYIPIDAVFTPVKNVRYLVENTRVEQKTDYEQLVLEIETDGSIHPEKALKESASILIQHFMLFANQTMVVDEPESEEPEEVDEEVLHTRKLLQTNLSEFGLSVRAYNCLKGAGVNTLGDLVRLEEKEMVKFRNFGNKSLVELRQLLLDKELTFGMDVSKYKLEEDPS